MGETIVVGNECQDALAQVSHRGPTGASEQTANQDREPHLNLVEPRTMLGRVDHANAMGRVGEKGGPRLHRGQMATFALDPQLLLDATQLGYQANQRFGLMGVELIGDEDPARLWIRLDGLFDVGSEVGFGAGRSQAGHDNLPGGHLQIGDQAQGAMPLVLEFLPLDVTGQHRQAGVQPLQGLNTSHLIGTQHMGALRGKRRGGFVDLTNRADLLGQLRGVVGWWSEPVPLAMGLQRTHLLKNVPPCGAKSA